MRQFILQLPSVLDMRNLVLTACRKHVILNGANVIRTKECPSMEKRNLLALAAAFALSSSSAFAAPSARDAAAEAASAAPVAVRSSSVQPHA